jgi:hypothetical protein
MVHLSVATSPLNAPLIYSGVDFGSLPYSGVLLLSGSAHLGATGTNVANHSADQLYRLVENHYVIFEFVKVVKVPRLRRHLSDTCIQVPIN